MSLKNVTIALRLVGRRMEMSKKWIPCELHTHTVHSDAKHTLIEMAEKARELEIACIALTDHNTTSGHMEKEAVTHKTGLQIIKGLEWTTFHGHMLTLGLSNYVDWRHLGIRDLHQGIKGVHEQEGVVGIAHPFRVGSPMCTGCYWEYDIKDWNEVDYIEVWSGIFPSIKQTNQRAFDWWTEVLDAGYKVSATSGRDWHDSSSPVDEPLSVTYLGLSHCDSELEGEELETVLVKAIKTGSMSVTLGPLLIVEIYLPGGDHVYEMGETVPVNENIGETVTVHISLDFTSRKKHWHVPEQDLEVHIKSNLGVLAVNKVNEKTPQCSIEIHINQLKWLRAELYGVINGCRTLIAFTNPIYGD